MAKTFKLTAPSGEKYETTSATEAVRLRSRGYKDQAPTKAKSSDK